jgi:hypothetical protein
VRRTNPPNDFGIRTLALGRAVQPPKYADVTLKQTPTEANLLRERTLPANQSFRIQDTERLIAAIHRDWGEAQANFHEFRVFTGLRPSEEIAPTVRDFDEARGTLSVTGEHVLGPGRKIRNVAGPDSRPTNRLDQDAGS